MTATERSSPKPARKRLLALIACGLILLVLGFVWRLVATDTTAKWQAQKLSDDALAKASAEPSAPAAYLLEWGKRLESNARFAEAEHVYARAMEAAPGKAEAWLGFGRTAVAANDWGKADAALAKTVDQWPENADAHFTYASILAGTFRIRKAIDQLKLGTKIDPTRGTPFQTIGDLELAEGDGAAAAESYATAIKLLPNEKGLRSRYGAALLSAGKVDQARTELEAALKEDPADMSARFTLGKALARTGKDEDRARALRELNRVIEFSNNKNGAYSEAARMWLAEGDRGNATQALEHAYDFFPYNVDTLTMLAKAYEDDGRQADAAKIRAARDKAKALADERTAIKSRLDAGEDLVGNLIRLGGVDRDAHNLSEAASAFTAANLLDPGNADAAKGLESLISKKPK